MAIKNHEKLCISSIAAPRRCLCIRLCPESQLAFNQASGALPSSTQLGLGPQALVPADLETLCQSLMAQCVSG